MLPLLVAFSLANVVLTSCPNGFVAHQRGDLPLTCYYIDWNTERDYPGMEADTVAGRTCQGKGGKLVSIEEFRFNFFRQTRSKYSKGHWGSFPPYVCISNGAARTSWLLAAVLLVSGHLSQ